MPMVESLHAYMTNMKQDGIQLLRSYGTQSLYYFHDQPHETVDKILCIQHLQLKCP